MPRKTVPISTRLSQEDAEFIASLTVNGASTPSEKLRTIIADARQRKEGTEDFPGSLRVAEDLLAPTMRIIRSSEHDAGMHSELVSRLGEWLPECLAYFIACNGASRDLDNDALVEIESGLADRVIVLMQSVLQMAITRTSPCYDPTVIRDRVQPVLDLADIISQK